MNKFSIIASEKPEEVARTVTAALREGWQLHGVLQIVQPVVTQYGRHAERYVQAIVKSSPDGETNGP